MQASPSENMLAYSQDSAHEQARKNLWMLAMHMLDAKHNGSYCKRMNQMDTKKRAQILGMMVEGMSIRAISRLTGASKNTLAKMIKDAGTASFMLRRPMQRADFRT
jgi:hypothetical protein